MIATESPDTLPRSIKIIELISSRYNNSVRPDSWDLRTSGTDLVLADDGKQYHLLSDGQQSPPQAGWTIILRDLETDDKGHTAYRWTLYGLG